MCSAVSRPSIMDRGMTMHSRQGQNGSSFFTSTKPYLEIEGTLR